MVRIEIDEMHALETDKQEWLKKNSFVSFAIVILITLTVSGWLQCQMGRWSEHKTDTWCAYKFGRLLVKHTNHCCFQNLSLKIVENCKKETDKQYGKLLL